MTRIPIPTLGTRLPKLREPSTEEVGPFHAITTILAIGDRCIGDPSQWAEMDRACWILDDIRHAQSLPESQRFSGEAPAHASLSRDGADPSISRLTDVARAKTCRAEDRTGWTEPGEVWSPSTKGYDLLGRECEDIPPVDRRE